MNGLFGTDVVALACILGGAAVGGAVTLAGGEEQVNVDCAEAVAESDARVVVAVGGTEPSIVVAPRVRVHRHEHCVRVDEQIQVDMARVQERLERAQERVMRAKERAGRAQVRIEGLDSEALAQEMARLEEELARLEDIGR